MNIFFIKHYFCIEMKQATQVMKSLNYPFCLFIFLQTGNCRFVPRTIIDTTAILSLDEEIKLNADEVQFFCVCKLCRCLKTN